jgi:hypothetical protein
VSIASTGSGGRHMKFILSDVTWMMVKHVLLRRSERLVHACQLRVRRLDTAESREGKIPRP